MWGREGWRRRGHVRRGTPLSGARLTCTYGACGRQVLSNDIFVNALLKSGSCCVLVSEENEEPIIVPEANAGRFCVAFDPLDGSSNIDCNVSTGTIFAVYEKARRLPPTSLHLPPPLLPLISAVARLSAAPPASPSPPLGSAAASASSPSGD